MPGKNHFGKYSGLHGPHRMRRAAIGLARFLLITLIMLGIGWVLEKVVNKAEMLELSHSQTRAIAAVRGIDPWQIKDRFFCALMPSAETTRRKTDAIYAGTRYAFLGQRPLTDDCAYSLAEKQLRAAAQAAAAAETQDPQALEVAAREPVQTPLITPVVGHWADGNSSFVMPVMAFLDTAWHLIVQPSVFASIFAIFAFVGGGILAGIAMALSKGEFPGYIGPLVWCLGTIACACLVAFALKEVMEGGLYLFGRFTQFAGLCCGSGTVTYFGYTFTVKALEVKTHGVVEHLVSR